MPEIKVAIFCIILIFLAMQSATSNLEEVPLISDSNLTADQAREILKSHGLSDQFERCFSADIKEGYMIPNGQLPLREAKVESGSLVSANISAGVYPILINKSIWYAKNSLDKKKINYLIIPGRKAGIKENIVYDQDPTNLTCLFEIDAIRLYVNKDLNISIQSPQSGDNVTKNTPVIGHVDPYIFKDDENLWVVVGPVKSPEDWWPQTGGPLDVSKNNDFTGIAFLGGQKGDSFRIGILAADKDLNRSITHWLENCTSLNYWPPITKEDPISNVMVPRKIIDENILAEVLVKLG
jgi:hypothetical protein